MTDDHEQARTFAAAARHLAEHPSATWVDLLEAGLMTDEALLAPEKILSFPLDRSREDLVAEFDARPMGPHSDELAHLLWRLRAQTRGGRYVLSRVGDDGWRVVRLIGPGRPRAEPVPGAAHATRPDAERAVFALRWADDARDDAAPAA